MIQEIQIKHFRCFTEASAPLRPLTVLIGENDSGKSSFLAALDYLARPRQWERTDHWRLNEKLPGRILARSGGRDMGAVNSNAPPTGSLHKLRPCRYFALPASGVHMTAQGMSDEQGPPELQADGHNVSALLDYLLRVDRDRFYAFEEVMRELVPGFEKITIATPSPEQRRVDFIIERGLKIPADNASAGVRLLIFFVALAYHPTPPRLILIEEPENGVHPKRLADVVRLLREVTQGKHGDHKAQVVLTTHSPHLLDCVKPDEDQVLVFSRNDDGSRGIAQADSARLKTFLDDFQLGEVWYNEGEEGLVAKKP